MIEKINLEWIKSFVYFAESGGVEEAAIKLNLTQPAITQHLSKLNAILPYSLFERQGKRKILSEYGREFYYGISKELKIIDDILRTSRFEGVNESDVTIRLGINNEIYYRICDKIEFDGQLEVYNHRSPEALKALLKRDVDVAITRVVPDSTELIAVKWYSDTFVLVHPKTWQREIDKEGLKPTLLKKKFILNLDSKAAIDEVLGIMNFLPQHLKYGHKLSNWHALIKLVEDGNGWAIVPSSFELSSKLQVVSINSKSVPKTQFYIIYHKSVRHFPGFQGLLSSMVASLK
ncbi:MAG: LysR family transcriptional regulator [Pseudobdellovibrionaceae bacterium]